MRVEVTVFRNGRYQFNARVTNLGDVGICTNSCRTPGEALRELGESFDRWASNEVIDIYESGDRVQTGPEPK